MNICILLLIHFVNSHILYDAIPGLIVENTLKHHYKSTGPQIREEICEDVDKCYLIYDMFGYIEYSEDFYDVSKWMPHKERINFDPYPIAICDAFFWSGAIPRHSSHKMYDVTVVGLGGGDFSNFYDVRYPHLNITVVELSPTVAYVAKKWFNVTESDRYRVVVQEGVSYFEELLIDEKRLDGILLDATYNSMNARYVSPVENFLTPSTLKLLSVIIKQDGALVSNVVVGKQSSDPYKALIEIVEMFQQFFAYVELAEMSTFNSVLIARHEPFLDKEKRDLYPAITSFQYLRL